MQSSAPRADSLPAHRGAGLGGLRGDEDAAFLPSPPRRLPSVLEAKEESSPGEPDLGCNGYSQYP